MSVYGGDRVYHLDGKEKGDPVASSGMDIEEGIGRKGAQDIVIIIIIIISSPN